MSGFWGGVALGGIVGCLVAFLVWARAHPGPDAKRPSWENAERVKLGSIAYVGIGTHEDEVPARISVAPKLVIAEEWLELQLRDLTAPADTTAIALHDDAVVSCFTLVGWPWHGVGIEVVGGAIHCLIGSAKALGALEHFGWPLGEPRQMTVFNPIVAEVGPEDQVASEDSDPT